MDNTKNCYKITRFSQADWQGRA